MKIVILMGSPNPKGSTSILVQSFKKGAEEGGHTVETIDVCRLNVTPCTGCVACGAAPFMLSTELMISVPLWYHNIKL